MIRYIRLYLYFLQFSFSRAMEFRFDFFFRIVMDLVYYGINIGFYLILFSHTTTLGGWNQSQMLVFVAGFLVVDAINMTVFANNLWVLPDFINKGELDYYLLRPVSSLFILSLRDFAANSFVNLIAAFGLLIYALVQYEGTLSVGGVILFILLLVVGAILRYLLRMCFLIPTFWLHAGRGFDMVFFQLNRFIERPHRIFTGVMRVLLTSVLPFSVMASFPASLLIDGFSWTIFAQFIAVTVGFSLFVAWFWKKGIRAYSSASS